MLRFSKIVFCKFVETLQELLYTPLATCFSNSAPAYTRNTKSPVLFPQKQRKPVMKVKALVIFMVLLGLVIFDEEGATLLPVRTHPAQPGLDNPTLVEPRGTTNRKVTQIDFPNLYLVQVIHTAILTIEVLSSPTDHFKIGRKRGRAPPLRI
jgi:hypothetical protein